MATLPHTTYDVTFDTALRTLAAQAHARYAGAPARIERGLMLALNGHVTLHADGTASVRSASDPEIVYAVHGHCDCTDASRAPGGRCKHRWATCLTRKAQQAQQGAPVTPRFYCTYYAVDGAWVSGTCQYIEGKGWLFAADDGSDLFYAAHEALALGGRVDLVAAQRAADGDLVRNVCGMGR